MALTKRITSRSSAVLVLHDLSADALIITKRHDGLRDHPGDLCFPGGYWEVSDSSLYATALREVEEELGVSAARITLLRPLQVETTLLGSVIHPWLAAIDSINPYQLNKAEVSALFSIPMSQVTVAQNYQQVTRERNGLSIKTWQFVWQDELIWGATARIMRQLIR